MSMASYRFLLYATAFVLALAWALAASCTVVATLTGLIVPANMVGGIDPAALNLLLS